jgi:hypothetical protein
MDLRARVRKCIQIHATTLRQGFGRQTESRKIRLDHLKMKLGITRPIIPTPFNGLEVLKLKN